MSVLNKYTTISQYVVIAEVPRLSKLRSSEFVYTALSSTVPLTFALILSFKPAGYT